MTIQLWGDVQSHVQGSPVSNERREGKLRGDKSTKEEKRMRVSLRKDLDSCDSETAKPA